MCLRVLPFVLPLSTAFLPMGLPGRSVLWAGLPPGLSWPGCATDPWSLDAGNVASSGSNPRPPHRKMRHQTPYRG